MILYEILVIVFTCQCYISAVILLNKMRKVEIKAFYACAGIFFILFGTCRIFYFVFDFIMNLEIFWTLGAVTGIAAISALYYAIEKTVVPQTKFVFTILSLIILAVYIVLIPFPHEISYLAQSILIPIVAPPIPVIYLYVAIKSEGKPRKLAIIFLIGSLVFILANMAHSQIVSEIAAIYFIASPIGFMVSCACFMYVMMQAAS